MSKHWTTKEMVLLKEYYPLHDANWEGWETILPGRSADAIYRFAHKHGISKTPNWTPFEITMLREFYPRYGSVRLHKTYLPSRTPSAISRKAIKLKVRYRGW